MTPLRWTIFFLLIVVIYFLSGCSRENVITVTATAYNSVAAQTDSQPGTAAWGDKLQPGMKAIAVSPDLIDLGLTRGTMVKIGSLPGTYTVLDRTASRLRNTIDIYMGKNVKNARKWGLRKVQITWEKSGEK